MQNVCYVTLKEVTTHELRITDLEGSTNFWKGTIFLWPILIN